MSEDSRLQKQVYVLAGPTKITAGQIRSQQAAGVDVISTYGITLDKLNTMADTDVWKFTQRADRVVTDLRTGKSSAAAELQVEGAERLDDGSFELEGAVISSKGKQVDESLPESKVTAATIVASHYDTIENNINSAETASEVADQLHKIGTTDNALQNESVAKTTANWYASASESEREEFDSMMSKSKSWQNVKNGIVKSEDETSGNGDDSDIRTNAAGTGNAGIGVEGGGDADSDSDGTGGTGTGSTGGDGDGSNDKPITAKQKTGNDEAVGNVAARALGGTVEQSNAAAYATAIKNEPKINNIFANNFYNANAVPHWAFSVDFIPSGSFKSEDMSLISTMLTKAVIQVALPSREMSSTVSHYKGMTIELPARANTSGELKITFAENEMCQINAALNILHEYARSTNYYSMDDNAATEYFRYYAEHANKTAKATNGELTTEEAIKNALESLRSYRSSPMNHLDHQFNILVKLYKPRDTKAFNDTNPDEIPSYVYYFRGCDLQTIDNIEFNYNSDDPVDISCVFMYQFVEEMTYYEYALMYGSMPAANPDARVINDAEHETLQNNGSFKDDLPSTQAGVDSLVAANSKSSRLNDLLNRANDTASYIPRADAALTMDVSDVNSTVVPKGGAEYASAMSNAAKQADAERSASEMAGYRPNSNAFDNSIQRNVYNVRR